MMIENGNDTEIKEDSKETNKNAFNNINQFLILLFFSEGYMLLISVIRIFFEGKDCSPQIAGINTVLLIFTIYQIRKNKGKKNHS